MLDQMYEIEGQFFNIFSMQLVPLLPTPVQSNPHCDREDLAWCFYGSAICVGSGLILFLTIYFWFTKF